MPARAAARRGFTIVEILIVVVILGILAAIAVPKFSNASQGARESTLKEHMRLLRTQITVYTAQHHDTPPGYPGGDRTATATGPDFINQLTQSSDENGNVSTTSSGVYNLGPYLTKMPDNPVNQKGDVLIAPDGAVTPDGSTGWIFQPTTGKFLPNLTGQDSDGKLFSAY